MRRMVHELGRLARSQGGQGSVEYALVLLAFIAACAALAALWHETQDGLLLESALGSASHSLDQGLVEASKDLVLY